MKFQIFGITYIRCCVIGRPISVDWAVPKDKYMQHIVHQQLELQDQVKKEESDSDDDGAQLNLSSDDIKPEVKSKFNSLLLQSASLDTTILCKLN